MLSYITLEYFITIIRVVDLQSPDTKLDRILYLTTGHLRVFKVLFHDVVLGIVNFENNSVSNLLSLTLVEFYHNDL